MVEIPNSLETDNQQIRESLNELARHYQIQKVTEQEEADIQEQLAKFQAFEGYEQVFIYGAMRVKHQGYTSYFIVVSLNKKVEGLTAYQGQVPGYTSLSYAGLTKLDLNYGSVTIRPETTTERIIDLFHPTNLKFQTAPDFHKHYRVVAENPDDFKQQVPRAFLQTIEKRDNLQLEIQGHDLLIKLPEGLSANVAQTLTDSLVAISQIG